MKNFLLMFAGLLMINFTLAQEMKPEDTEIWEPEPGIVTPGKENAPPSDATVLFDGSGFSNWEAANGGEAKWNLGNGAMTVQKGAGDIRTKQSFGDCQLHIEWRTPSEVAGDSQGRGNSGIFLQSTYEVQVLDSYNNRTYSNGQAASIYKQHPPLVNACRPPGEWQTYDIFYEAPIFHDDGSLARAAFITVIHNGILVQNHVMLKGHTPYIGLPKYTAHGDLPIRLQDHGNPVSYRNIWIRELK
ncbi:MAG: DUF1080 domain-containing protein [Cyclobacteriaceae bacterium]|nr:DUF1080 domain-containing protein [Cyclobacteriaceae bacterium]